MDRLAALGVIPGSEIRLHQRSPAFVIEVGETTIALDPEIAGEIFVKALGERELTRAGGAGARRNRSISGRAAAP